MKFVQSGFNLKVNKIRVSLSKNVFEKHVLKCPMSSGKLAVKEKLSCIACDGDLVTEFLNCVASRILPTSKF